MSCTDLSKAYGISSYELCSGHGSCVLGLCVCDEGWTGFGDFEFVPGYDCDMNIGTLREWGCFNLALASLAAIFVLSYAIRENIFSGNMLTNVKAHAFISFFFAAVFGIFYYSVKVYSPDRNVIGMNPYLSLTTILIVFFVVLGISCYIIIFLKFLKGYSKFFDAKVKSHFSKFYYKVAVFSRIVPFLMLLGSSASIIPLHFLPPAYSDGFSAFFSIVVFLGHFFYSFIVITVINLFLNELKKHLIEPNALMSSAGSSVSDRVGPFQSPGNDIQILYNTMSKANKVIQPLIILGAPINLIVASWSIIRRKQSYVIMMDYTVIVLLCVSLTWSLVRKKATSSVVPIVKTQIKQPIAHQQGVMARISNVISYVRLTKSDVIEGRPVDVQPINNVV